jgi:aryl-alcohol dehydrogenase-like predicted oxidoreductase
MAQIALAWVLAQPAVTSAIVGPSKLSQLDDNLLAADLALEPDELRDLGAATLPQPIYPSSMDRSMGFPEPGEPITG